MATTLIVANRVKQEPLRPPTQGRERVKEQKELPDRSPDSPVIVAALASSQDGLASGRADLMPLLSEVDRQMQTPPLHLCVLQERIDRPADNYGLGDAEFVGELCDRFRLGPIHADGDNAAFGLRHSGTVVARLLFSTLTKALALRHKQTTFDYMDTREEFADLADAAVTVHLRDDQIERLDALAEKTRQRRTDLIRIALDALETDAFLERQTCLKPVKTDSLPTPLTGSR